ncbi:phage holin family protein [Methylophaga sp.]|uniref:phage holin family protein n=1 Tax=Methylophaga sp. TaxID=2024840 RepID=UPI0025F1462B|nr:phage holin family protein [Methylophaga sp.]
MIDKDPTTYSMLTYLWVLGISMLGGFVSYARKRRMNLIPRFSITELIGEVFTSAFAGLVTFFLCESANLDPMLSAALIAISGHMGSRAIFLAEDWLQAKYGKYIDNNKKDQP